MGNSFNFAALFRYISANIVASGLKIDSDYGGDILAFQMNGQQMIACKEMELGRLILSQGSDRMLKLFLESAMRSVNDTSVVGVAPDVQARLAAGAGIAVVRRCRIQKYNVNTKLAVDDAEVVLIEIHRPDVVVRGTVVFDAQGCAQVGELMDPAFNDFFEREKPLEPDEDPFAAHPTGFTADFVSQPPTRH